MLRKIIRINEDLCNGCGACITACHEGAIDLIDGKARLTREHYCDGLGDCLPACPMNAITFELREAPAYDEEAVKAAQAKKNTASPCSRPGSMAKAVAPAESCLRQWPVQLKLLPIVADFYDDADLLIAADCAAYTYANFHNDFMKNKTTLIGCPKLDAVDYAEKLFQIILHNHIRSITIARMQVPCCGGLQSAVERAVQASGKNIPVTIKIISTNGTVLN